MAGISTLEYQKWDRILKSTGYSMEQANGDFAAMAERMAEGMKKIASQHRGGTILVTSHAAAIRALWGKISGYKPSEWADAFPFPTNASYSVLEYDGESLKPLSYSNDSHLGELVTFIQH